MNAPNDLKISIAICTYNRSQQLAVTLQSLCKIKDQLLVGDEILVVDNNSSDDTKELVQEYSKILPIRYLFESEQGLSHARNRALNEFSSRLIVFFDDDITVSKEAIERYRSVHINYSEYDFFGGQIDVEWADCAPSWYQDNSLPLINGLLGNYNLGLKDKRYTKELLLPYGANFALTRKLVQSLGLFDANLGVKGEEIGRGEETDYFNRAIDQGFSGMYLSNTSVGHRFQQERLSIHYFYRYGIEKGRALVLVDNANYDHYWIISMLNFLLKGGWQLLKGRRDRFYQCIINIGIERGINIATKSLH